MEPTAFVIGFSQSELPSLGRSKHLKTLLPSFFPILLSLSRKTQISGQSDRQKVTTLRSEHRTQIKCFHSLTSSTSNYQQISTFTKLVLLHLMPPLKPTVNTGSANNTNPLRKSHTDSPHELLHDERSYLLCPQQEHPM